MQHAELDQSFQRLVAGFPGRVGVCAIDAAGASCVNGDESFSLQSVMKLIVAVAAMDAADHGKLDMDQTIIVHRADLSLYVEPIADLTGLNGFRTTYRDLIHRAIVDSDSAAADILVRRLGGPAGVEQFLVRDNVQGIRIDRDERHLQTEIVGLQWQPSYVDPEVLKKAIAAVPVEQREKAYRAYQKDPGDTATPLGMASFLERLGAGKLLSPASTRFVLQTMAQTTTFPDRLKAGMPPGWICMHKTGTSGSWQGVTAATNDVGILRAPDGTLVSIAVFVADTRTPSVRRAALMRHFAAATAAAFRP